MIQGTETIGGAPAGRRAVRGLLGLGAIVVAIVALGGVALLAFAAISVDRLQAREERAMVRHTIDRELAALVSDLTTATIWDQSYTRLMPNLDLAWADDEIGSYFANNRGHDRVAVLDGDERPFYAWLGQSRVRADALNDLVRDSGGLLRRVRRIEASHPLRANMLQNEQGLGETASGIVRSQGVYYLVAVSTVVPEHPGAPRRPGRSVVMLCAERVDGRLVRVLRDELRMTGPAIFVSEPARPGVVVLRNPEGAQIGWIGWDVKRPGLESVRRAMPLLLPGFALLALAALALVLRIRRVLRELDAYETGQREALAESVEARDRAEAANLAKSQFLANMSHEIRTPLNGVLGMAQVMERSGLGSPHREHLKIIRDSGETLLAILNDVLDLSKIEAGHLELDDHVFDLARTVAVACRPFALLADQKDVTFATDIAPDALGYWRGDSVRLRQVLSNLASNAVKFTHEGRIRLSVGTNAADLVFTLSDTGIGIAPDRIGDLFEKFVQADSSTTRRFGGTGLGLAICRELIERMGGTLRMDSVPGEGSIFVFRLPFARAEADDVIRAAKAPGEDDIRRLRVLAAEDNTTNQVILRALLEPIGVELRTVANGREAVEAFQSADYDLILMDVQMPVMNGVEATRAIRAREAERGLAPIPILALSANVMSHQVRDYAEAGMDGVVAKPVDAGALITAIAAAMERGSFACPPMADTRSLP
jgi:signal transduction histidine kinase/ActR/RegA family two-component response regulator